MKSIIEKVKSAKRRSLAKEEKKIRRNMKISSGILIFFILTKYYLFPDVGVDFILGWIGIPIVAGILAYQHTRYFGWKGILGCVLVIPLSFNYATPLFPMRSLPTPAPGMFSTICCVIGIIINVILKEDSLFKIIKVKDEKEVNRYKKKILCLAIVLTLISYFLGLIFVHLDFGEYYYIYSIMIIIITTTLYTISNYSFVRSLSWWGVILTLILLLFINKISLVGIILGIVFNIIELKKNKVHNNEEFEVMM